MADIVVHWNDAAYDQLMNSVTGPVADLLRDLSGQIVMVARATVHVRDPATRDRRRRAGRNSSAHAPGYTRSLIRPHLGRGALTGQLYGGANAPGSPGLFLEYPAEQYTKAYPFLTTGLDSLMGAV